MAAIQQAPWATWATWMAAFVVQGMLTATSMAVQVRVSGDGWHQRSEHIQVDFPRRNASLAKTHRAGRNSCAADQYAEDAIVWDCTGHSDSVTENNWARQDLQHISTIPVGAMDLEIIIQANADIDTHIMHGSTCIIGYACTYSHACPTNPDVHCHNYQNMDIYFSGDDTSDPVTEIVRFDGPTTVELELKANPWVFIPTATVTYSYSGISPCSSTVASCNACSNYPNCLSGTVPQCDGSATVTCATPVSGGSAAMAIGDPHLQNIYGERFDLLRPGKVVLIHIPRGKPVKDALLVVEANAVRLGGQCADMYFQNLNITGAWTDKANAGSLHFDANLTRDEQPKWMKFGPVELKVAHGRTDTGIVYLNFYIKHLKFAGFDVGGVLGADDHSEAATPTETCHKQMALSGKPTPKSLNKSVALATLG